MKQHFIVQRQTPSINSTEVGDVTNNIVYCADNDFYSDTRDEQLPPAVTALKELAFKFTDYDEANMAASLMGRYSEVVTVTSNETK